MNQRAPSPRAGAAAAASTCGPGPPGLSTSWEITPLDPTRQGAAPPSGVPRALAAERRRRVGLWREPAPDRSDQGGGLPVGADRSTGYALAALGVQAQQPGQRVRVPSAVYRALEAGCDPRAARADRHPPSGPG